MATNSKTNEIIGQASDLTGQECERAGLLLLCKHSGYTSFESLGLVKKALGTGKVGHTGTLDKFATGLLLVLTGRALKLSPWFDGCDKRYEGTIRFGSETDTLDPEGAVVAEAPPPSLSALEAALAQFRGPILQVPPAYSAVHVDGRRAHELARAGEAPEMKPRPVTIHALELLSYEPPLARVFVHCSKGAYIRSLARDIALAAGSRAHLVALRRTQIAGFRLEDALDLSESAAPAEAAPAIVSALRRPDTAVFDALGLPWIAAGAGITRLMAQGRPLDSLNWDPDSALRNGGALAVFEDAGNGKPGELAAVLEKKPGPAGEPGRWTYGYVWGGRRAGV
jgi:tRNA pseudouridine55 synthase